MKTAGLGGIDPTEQDENVQIAQWLLDMLARAVDPVVSDNVQYRTVSKFYGVSTDPDTAARTLAYITPQSFDRVTGIAIKRHTDFEIAHRSIALNCERNGKVLESVTPNFFGAGQQQAFNFQFFDCDLPAKGNTLTLTDTFTDLIGTVTGTNYEYDIIFRLERSKK